MPSTITHAYFGKDLYNKLPNKIKNKLLKNEKHLMMFSQSTDPLMFYNIYYPISGKKIRNLQKVFHNKKTNEFFTNLITYMKNNKYYNDSKSLAFLYGLISHFCLDSTAHPYIFYKTGVFIKNDKKTYKYNGYHTYMENYIDNHFLSTRNNNHKFKISNFCFDLEKFSKELNDCIDYSFSKTYNINNMSKKYYKSLIHMKNFITIFRMDKYGIKKQGYKLIDLFTPKSTFRFKSLSYKVDDYTSHDFLNLAHKKWCYPVDNKKTSTKNFEELYEEALNKALSIIKEVNHYFFDNKEIDINSLFNNISYSTGIDCDSKLKQRFFEF